MQCPKCKAEVNQQAQFCWQCGATMASAPLAAAAPRPAGGNRWAVLAVVLTILFGVALAFLTVTLRSRAGSITTGGTGGRDASARVNALAPESTSPTPSAPLTAASSGNTPAGTPLTATPPGELPSGTGVARGTAPTPDLYAADVAAYLRKLEAIQYRDSQNPMAQLFAMMATGLGGLGGALKDIQGEGVGEVPSGAAPDYQGTFDKMLAAKQALVREFGAITPVPPPCQRLHETYKRYLDALTNAISQLRDAVAQGGNPGAPIAALPAGQAAQTAQSAATAEEDAVRRRYNIPRNAMPVIP